MSEQINDGGPAFPVADFDHQVFMPGTVDNAKRLLSGMSLRDYFAAHASENEIFEMLGRIPNIDKVVLDGSNRRIVSGLPDNARQMARYMVADAMLQAREE